jgi:hypothetical protein
LACALRTSARAVHLFSINKNGEETIKDGQEQQTSGINTT